MVPDLSVIIPVFNRGELIRYTLESVRRASAGLDVETIVIDDGSTTPVAADLARLGYAVTKIHRQENRGLLFARLAGLAHVTGRYTLFLDSDDLFLPGKLSTMAEALAGDGGRTVLYSRMKVDRGVDRYCVAGVPTGRRTTGHRVVCRRAAQRTGP
jgi:glycosyltransferase involved in cell wall biosynthesis